MKKGIVCLGEALIDFIPLDASNLTYQKSPGGAPANAAVGAARLGARASFLGKVGDDILGRFLKETLDGYGVDTAAMVLGSEARTGAVFVTLSEDGERDFYFYIDPSADRFLKEEDLNGQLFEEHKLLHIGSISMISEPSKSATEKAVELAKRAGMIVSFDPNLRLSLWKDEETARAVIKWMLDKADILKVSEEELEFLTGKQSIEEGLASLSGYEIPFTLVTLGAEGSYLSAGGKLVKVPAMKVEAVDTTGAGDAYVSGMLYKINERGDGVNGLSEEELWEIGRFASISGGLAASTKGAMTALPTLEEVERLLK
ncbi:aminoimidazole riboside kinase [Bacillus marinisedimentorum]|uniref:aminoimidazole riboside kinase n=1 Tax=Bacillus marinisedimentorum TaxID=1821260 RepID=UPI0007E1F4E8|nr:aminoimidazole riboside kinase [Bacillus marinisedimentorum]